MSLLAWVAVALLGSAGALLRFALDGSVSGRFGRRFPAGTFAVNISGAFVLGLVAGTALHGTALVLVGTATLGSYTTFSTWMLETHRLREGGEGGPAIWNLVISVVVGFGAVVLGHAVGTAL